ncbi:MAG: hypothetical protein ACRD4R_05380 [Candidatus Acidiferrales bacterium]
MERTHLVEAASTCCANGERLLDAIEYLDSTSQRATCVALATIAQEEFAKAFLLILVARNVIAWNKFIYRATRDHTCKQLLGIVMDYINPEDDWERSMAWFEEHKKRTALLDAYKSTSDYDERQTIWRQLEAFAVRDSLLPRSVADSINIFRYEKIGRWESSGSEWEELQAYDETAKQVAAGKLDRAKQDALYVRLGKDGSVASSPFSAEGQDGLAAIQMAKRLRDLASRLLTHPGSGGIEYGKAESAFRAVFGTDGT